MYFANVQAQKNWWTHEKLLSSSRNRTSALPSEPKLGNNSLYRREEKKEKGEGGKRRKGGKREKK